MNTTYTAYRIPKITFTTLSVFLITLVTSSAGWLTVNSPSPVNASADWIRENYAGSGLGAVVWGTYVKTKNPDATASKCCTDRCWCGTISQMVEISFSCRLYIANTQTDYTVGGATGNITGRSQSDALSHENSHVKIMADLAGRWNPYVASKYTTITTDPHSTEKQATDAAKRLANLFDSNCRIGLVTRASSYSTTLDSERSDVINGEWRHPAINRSSLIFVPISQLTVNTSLPTDNSQNCQ